MRQGWHREQFGSSILARAILHPRLVYLTFETSSLPVVPTPGQFFMARCEGAYLRRPVFPCHVEANRIAVVLPLVNDPAVSWLAERHVGDTVDLIGPLGQGFALGAPAGNLLLVSLGLGIAPLLSLAEEALTMGWTVSLLSASDRSDLTVPTALLPPAVEYRVAVGEDPMEELVDLLHEVLPWADSVCASGPRTLQDQLAALFRDVRMGIRRGVAQVLVESPMGCGVGACGSCAVETHRGSRQVCCHGPVFDLADLVTGYG